MKQILILEDDFDIRNLYVMALERENYVVHATATVDEAVRICHKLKHIDLALIDFRLQNGHTGLELIRNIDCYECDCKRILVTAWADDQRIIDAADLFDEILKKPITCDLVLECIERHIGPAIDYSTIFSENEN